MIMYIYLTPTKHRYLKSMARAKGYALETKKVILQGENIPRLYFSKSDLATKLQEHISGVRVGYTPQSPAKMIVIDLLQGNYKELDSNNIKRTIR